MSTTASGIAVVMQWEGEWRIIYAVLESVSY